MVPMTDRTALLRQKLFTIGAKLLRMVFVTSYRIVYRNTDIPFSDASSFRCGQLFILCALLSGHFALQLPKRSRRERRIFLERWSCAGESKGITVPSIDFLAQDYWNIGIKPRRLPILIQSLCELCVNSARAPPPAWTWRPLLSYIRALK